MKIMHIAQSAGYGVTIYVESLLRGLPASKYEQWLLGSEYYNTKHFEEITSGIDTIPMERDITIHDISTIFRCRSIIKKRKPDLVYCHSAKAGVYGRIACLGTGIKVIYNPHGWAFNMKCSSAKKFFYKGVETFFSLLTDRIVTISDYEKETSPWLISRKKIVKILNGIDIEEDERILRQSTLTRSDVGISKDKFVIGLIARISIQKGQDLLVEVARRIADEIPEAFFVMVGDKSDDVPIEKKIEENQLKDRFLITGEVLEAIRYAALFDIAVLTSRWEGFGLVLPEYMLAKKAIVAFNVDAISEVVQDGITGILVGKEDVEGMAHAIIDLYRNPEKVQNYASAGYKDVKKRFDLKRVIKEHEQLFEQL